MPHKSRSLIGSCKPSHPLYFHMRSNGPYGDGPRGALLTTDESLRDGHKDNCSSLTLRDRQL